MEKRLQYAFKMAVKIFAFFVDSMICEQMIFNIEFILRNLSLRNSGIIMKSIAQDDDSSALRKTVQRALSGQEFS